MLYECYFGAFLQPTLNEQDNISISPFSPFQPCILSKRNLRKWHLHMSPLSRSCKVNARPLTHNSGIMHYYLMLQILNTRCFIVHNTRSVNICLFTEISCWKTIEIVKSHIRSSVICWFTLPSRRRRSRSGRFWYSF